MEEELQMIKILDLLNQFYKDSLIQNVLLLVINFQKVEYIKQ